MSRGINKVILIGNLGQDPEVRALANGNSVANVSIATTESWKDKNTEQTKEKTEWHRVVFFGKLADIVGQYLKKGSKVYIEGRLQTRKWQDKSGQDRYTTEVVVDVRGTMQMLDSREGAPAQPNPNSAGPGGQQVPQPQNPAQHAAGDGFGDDIPFARKAYHEG